MKKAISEATGHIGAPASMDEPGRLQYHVRVITPGWGSSGFYAAEMLTRSVAEGVWRDGTKVYLDHPSVSAERDQPERTLRDLVGKISTARMEADGVHGVLTVLPHMREVVESLATDGDLDMSIRAYAEAEPGEAEGRRGMIITRITEALSVDLVTEAGAGGRVLELIESARKNPDHEIAEATASERAEQLKTALMAAYAQTDDDYLWVRDFDDAKGLVWFEQADCVYQQAYTATDHAITLTGEPLEVRPVTTYLPVTPDSPAAPAGNATQPPNQEAHMATIDDNELAQLRESAARVSTLESERDTTQAELDALKTELAEARKAEAVAKIDAADLPEAAKQRLRESLTPDTDVAAAIAAEADYIAQIAPKQPLGFGESHPATESTQRPRVNAWGREIKEA